MIVGKIGDTDVYHSVSDDFSGLMRAALLGEPAYCALGPVYGSDPAEGLLAPFVRTAQEIGLDPRRLPFDHLVPDNFLHRIHAIRAECFESSVAGLDPDNVGDWTKAGLVLEVSSRRGIPLRGGGRAHVRWKMRGTVTGRFGVEAGSFNPLVIPRDKRKDVVPSSPSREIVAIDFSAMDLCSMIAIVPDIAKKYEGSVDLHLRTAELVGITRDEAKRELFVHAYGGSSPLADEFKRKLPELEWLRSKPHGDGARLVQETSARAFRAGLARALPLLTGDDVCPLFTVHDELVLDAEEYSRWTVSEVAGELMEGASERIGVAYSVGIRIGKDYAEAKR